MTPRSAARVLQGFFDRVEPARVLPGMRPPAAHAVQPPSSPWAVRDAHALSTARAALQRRAGSGATGDVRATRLLPGQLRSSGPGRPLGADLRPRLEGLLQANLSSVRVHQGPAAGALGALAFTLGEDVYFAPGQYDPRSQEGLALLGHELTHVLQQRAGLATNPFRDGIAVVQDPALEAEADAIGKLVGERRPIIGALHGASWLSSRPSSGHGGKDDRPGVRIPIVQRSAAAPKKGLDTAKYSAAGYEWVEGVDNDAKLTACVEILIHRKKLLSDGHVKMGSAHQIQLIKGRPPLYIVSAGRGAWIETNLKSLWVTGMFGERTIVFVTEDGCSDYDFLDGAGFAAQGVHRLVVAGGYGIGWFRNCALTHARRLGATEAWVADDNIIRAPQLSNYDARIPKTGAVCFDTRKLLAVLVGFNLRKLSNLNFCPFFVYSKEDLTFQQVLASKFISIEFIADDNYKKAPVDKTSMPAKVAARRAAIDVKLASLDLRKQLTLYVVNPSVQDILKFHEQVIFDFIKFPDRARDLARFQWFTDLE